MAYSAGTALDDNTLGEALQAAVREAMESQAVQLFKEASNKAFEVGKQVVEDAGDWIEANPHKVEMALGAMAAISQANASNGGRRTAGMWKSWRIGGKQRASQSEVKWIDEKAGMNSDARAYNDSACGARSNAATQKPQAPSLNYKAKDGSHKSVRFDGVDENILIDRKLSVVTTSKVKDQALRQSRALEQNGMTARWEVPNNLQKSRADKLLADLKIRNIEVKIVEK